MTSRKFYFWFPPPPLHVNCREKIQWRKIFLIQQYLELPAEIAPLEAIYKSKRNQLDAAGDVNVNVSFSLLFLQFFG